MQRPTQGVEYDFSEMLGRVDVLHSHSRNKHKEGFTNGCKPGDKPNAAVTFKREEQQQLVARYWRFLQIRMRRRHPNESISRAREPLLRQGTPVSRTPHFQQSAQRVVYTCSAKGLLHELLSKLLVSPLLTLIVVPYLIPYIPPFKEFRP